MFGRAVIVVALLAVVAVQAGECPGKCLDSRTAKCDGGKFVTGKCAGPAHIQCCVEKAAAAPIPQPRPAQPQAPASQPQAPAAKCEGVCQSKSLPCGAAYISGVCPGSASNQCCPKPVQNTPATPATPTPVAPASGAWAPFQTIWQKYPHGEAEDVKRRIGGAINAAYITNTCTIRVSRALTEAGMKINPITLADGNNMLLVKGANGVGLPIRVKEFSQWVVKRFGQPQIKVVNRGDGTEDVPQQFLGKKGLIKFDVRVWSDATGHFDLWDGEACAHNCYFDKAKEVWLWTIA